MNTTPVVTMKTLLIVSLVLCAALLIQTATVAPYEAVAVTQEDKPAPDSDAAANAVSLAQARVQFCLDGWLSFRDNCYLLVNNPSTWGSAESYCAAFDANLASIHNIWEHNFVQRLVKTGGHTFGWIGGYYFQNQWRWEDGSSLTYPNWERQYSTELYQCIQISSQESKGWSNQACNVRLPFVCQVNPHC